MSWHRCERWFDRGYPCPFRLLGVDDDDEPSDEEEDRRKAQKALPIPIVGDRLKKEPVSDTRIINIEDYINEQPPVDVPIPHKVAASRLSPPKSGPGQVPLFRPTPGRGGRPGAGAPLPQDAWTGHGAKELASGITAGVSAPRDVLGVGASHSLWTAPKSMPVTMSARVIHVPRFGTPPLPLFENELARATQAAKQGSAPAVRATTLGVRATPQPVHQGFGRPPAEIAAETAGVQQTIRRPQSNFSQREATENTWGITAAIASAMAGVAIYALGKGGIGGAAAIEKAITQRVPDNRRPGATTRGSGRSVRPGGQVFNFWDMLNGLGFQ